MMSRIRGRQPESVAAPKRSVAGRGRWRAAFWLALAGLSALPAARLGAQERKPFVVNRVTASTDIEAEYYRDETRSKDGARTVIEQSIFRQLVRAGIGGYSFDPRLLRYQLDVELGYDLLSSRFESSFPSDIPSRGSAWAPRINYDLLVQLFPDSMNALSLWSRRRDLLLSQMLYGAYSVQEQAYGARFDTRWPVAPSSLQFEYRDLKEEGLFDKSHEQSADLLYQMKRDFGPNSRLDVLYEYLRVRRETDYRLGGPKKILEEEDTQRGEVYHEYRFGPDLRSILSSQLSILDQRGTFPFRNILARERLLLQHTPNFQTYYGLTYQQTDIGQNSVRTETIEAGLRHQLYQNLISRLEARLRHSDEPDYSWNEGDILGNESYRRRNPLGELFINALVRETYRRYDRLLGATNTVNDYFEILQEFRNLLRVYYRIEDMHLKVGPQQGMTITDSTLQTIGYEIPWDRWTWLQEYRHLDDTLGLTDGLRSEIRTTFRLPWRASLNAGLMDDEVDYHGRLPHSHYLSGHVNYVLPFARTGLWEIEAIYGDQTGIVNQRDWRARTSLEWQWRKLKFQMLGQFGLFENDAVQESGTHLMLTVSRKLR
jgi:hypothetical protein